MAELHRAELSLDGRAVVYESDFDLGTLVKSVQVEHASVLILQVDDFADAQELLQTLDRSRARKSAKKEPAKGNGQGEEPAAATSTSSPPPVVPQPREVPPTCEAIPCTQEGKPREDSGGNFCDGCATSLGVNLRKAAHKAFLKTQADKARAIVEGLEKRPAPAQVS